MTLRDKMRASQAVLDVLYRAADSESGQEERVPTLEVRVNKVSRLHGFGQMTGVSRASASKARAGSFLWFCSPGVLFSLPLEGRLRACFALLIQRI